MRWLLKPGPARRHAPLALLYRYTSPTGAALYLIYHWENPGMEEDWYNAARCQGYVARRRACLT